MLPYRINLSNWEHASEGDVITRDGEYLGRWRIDPKDGDGFISFIPRGESHPAFSSLLVGSLCERISSWLERHDDSVN